MFLATKLLGGRTLDFSFVFSMSVMVVFLFVFVQILKHERGK